MASYSATAQSAAPSVETALSLSPVQKQDIEYDIPVDPGAVAECTVRSEKIGRGTGWVLRDGADQVLRRFIDTDGDNVVDMWCYYRNGLEVYRDIDTNKNGKADQFRWLNIAGSRWGVDTDEDGQVDSWKQISAEEVSAEVVRALGNHDVGRFQRLLLSAAELKSLGLGEDKETTISKLLADAPKGFLELAGKQRQVTSKTEWIHFGGSVPGIVPSETDGSTKDVFVYEGVVAMIETDGKDGQVQIGTLIKLDETWRLIDAPQLPDPTAQAVATGVFFRPTAPVRGAATAQGAPDERSQQLMAELERIDKAVAAAQTPEEQAKLNARRADLLEEIAASANSSAERAQWYRQLADMIGAAVQSGAYPDGVERLEKLFEKLSKTPTDQELAAHVKFVHLAAEYTTRIQNEKDFVKIQEAWLKNLENFVGQFPQSPDAAEAMLQLGIAQEFAGQDDDAKKWYGRIVNQFPKVSVAAKAAGAVRRLDSVGKSVTIRGNSPTGGVVDLSQYRRKVVLVHYWATWCEPCKADLALIKELYASYAKRGFAVIGVSLDSNADDLTNYLRDNRLPWQQIYEEGGLESRMANEMGILTLPTMLLIDSDGNVVNRNIHVTELERELRTRLR
jgi:thiol-disulfide isomerase/thioredoxin